MRCLVVLLAACGSHAGAAADAGDAAAADACTAPAYDVSLAERMAHDTSANPAYDRAHFAANFGSATWISQAGATIAVDPDRADMSLNPVTPGHVSSVDVHTLIPSRPDLRWFAHSVPWFKPGGGNHIDIGIDSNSDAYVAAMIEDMKRRGFDGVVVDWYGQNSYEDLATRRMQAYLDAHPQLAFSLILMMDKGIANLSASVLEQQIAYVDQQYFHDPHYEREGGKPILMFFGVEAVLGATAMAQVKAATGNAQVWVVQGAGSLASAWVDQSFDWSHDYHDGPSATDPYDLAGVAAYYAAIGKTAKQAFGSLSAGFDGTLTRTVSWSQGKYLPRGDGACLVRWAATIDGVIPANVTRMQWVTWSDWEEGTAVEPGVESAIALAAAIDGDHLAWTVSGGGGEPTIDHYEIYATEDGERAALVASVAAGTHELPLASLPCGLAGDAELVVIAVGKPMIRDHASAPVALQ
ncbi:MAG: hypothetical protein ACM31C_02625 [Acidobacteriota bacterium]